VPYHTVHGKTPVIAKEWCESVSSITVPTEKHHGKHQVLFNAIINEHEVTQFSKDLLNYEFF